jgi:hypothetical protein
MVLNIFLMVFRKSIFNFKKIKNSLQLFYETKIDDLS